jgi:hypothetical protein
MEMFGSLDNLPLEFSHASDHSHFQFDSGQHLIMPTTILTDRAFCIEKGVFREPDTSTPSKIMSIS